MSKVISIRFRDPQVERLGRMARRLNRSPSETAAILLDEALRMAEYAHIIFRDSPVGRQAYLAGTGLAIWEISSLATTYGDISRIAEHLEISPLLVQAALTYARDFPQEITAAIEDNASYDRTRLSRMFPQIEIVEETDGIGASPNEDSQLV